MEIRFLHNGKLPKGEVVLLPNGKPIPRKRLKRGCLIKSRDAAVALLLKTNWKREILVWIYFPNAKAKLPSKEDLQQHAARFLKFAVPNGLAISYKN